MSANGDQIIGTHVDDLIGIAPEESNLDRIEQSIEKTVELEKSGRPPKVLGIELAWNKNNTEVVLIQRALIESIYQKHGKGGIKSSLPLDEWYYIPRISEEEQAEAKQES